jgi:hypothetical protein
MRRDATSLEAEAAVPCPDQTKCSCTQRVEREIAQWEEHRRRYNARLARNARAEADKENVQNLFDPSEISLWP